MENQSNYFATPKLGFGEAVKRVLSNVINFKGRARRSEFWWYMLAVCIVNFILSLALGSMPLLQNIVSIIISLSAVSVTVRRVQDSGHNPIWVYIEFVSSIFLATYMFTSGYIEMLNTVNPNPNAIIGFVLNPMFWLPALVATVTSIVIFVFCLFDGTVGPNKYGDSPKYVSEDTITK